MAAIDPLNMRDQKTSQTERPTGGRGGVGYGLGNWGGGGGDLMRLPPSIDVRLDRIEEKLDGLIATIGGAKPLFIKGKVDKWAVEDAWLHIDGRRVIPASDLPEFTQFLQSEVERLGLAPAADPAADGDADDGADVAADDGADGDGWTKWEGGECPVDPNVNVEVKFAVNDGDGEHVIGDGIAGKFGWQHGPVGPRGYAIIAYRISGNGGDE